MGFFDRFRAKHEEPATIEPVQSQDQKLQKQMDEINLTIVAEQTAFMAKEGTLDTLKDLSPAQKRLELLRLGRERKENEGIAITAEEATPLSGELAESLKNFNSAYAEISIKQLTISELDKLITRSTPILESLNDIVSTYPDQGEAARQLAKIQLLKSTAEERKNSLSGAEVIQKQINAM